MEKQKEICLRERLSDDKLHCIKIKDKAIIELKNLKVGSLIEIEHLDSLGKDIKEIRNLLRGMYSKKISLKVDENVFDFNCGFKGYVLIIDILSYIIEQHANGVKVGIEMARKKGKQIGRRKLSVEDLPEKFLASYESYKKGLITKIEFAEMCSCSRPTLNSWIKCFESENVDKCKNIQKL